MGDDTKYQIIMANKEDSDLLNAAMKKMKQENDDWKLKYADAVDAANKGIWERMDELEAGFNKWAKARDAFENSAIRQRKKEDAVRAKEHRRHMNAVEKFLALIAKRIK